MLGIVGLVNNNNNNRNNNDNDYSNNNYDKKLIFHIVPFPPIMFKSAFT